MFDFTEERMIHTIVLSSMRWDDIQAARVDMTLTRLILMQHQPQTITGTVIINFFLCDSKRRYFLKPDSILSSR